MNILEDIYTWNKASGRTQEGSKEQFDLTIDLIKEELEELIIAHKNGDKAEQADAIIDLIWVITQWGYFNDLGLKYQAQKVSKSNWGKFCITEEDAQKTVNMYATGTHSDKPGIKIETYYKKVEDYYVILRRSDNKIMKSWLFKNPNS